MATKEQMLATADVQIRILRAGVVENLMRGTMARAREAATLLAERIGSRTILRLSRGSKVLIDIPVDTVNEASAIWSAYRDARGFGASTAPRADLMVDGVKRGHVSYNGRVWEGEYRPGTLPVYDPLSEVAS